jgi:1-acyl-sn-glycerol-3-phosphate acyltransferase
MGFDCDRLDARDPRLIAALARALRVVNRHYLRLEAAGTEHLPRGRALFVANHNGGTFGPDHLCTMRMLCPSSPASV